MEHCFIMTHSIHNWGDYKFTLVWHSLNKAPRTGPHHIRRIYTLCPFSGHNKNTDDRAVGWMILLASVCYCDSRVGKHFFNSESGVSNQNFIDGFLLAFVFFPGHCHGHLQWSALFTLLYMIRHSCSNPVPLRYERLLQWQQNRSKSTMWQV